MAKLNDRNATLSQASRAAARKAALLDKINRNCGSALNRLAGRFEPMLPTRPNHLRLVYVGTGTTRNEAAADIAFLHRVIETTLDEKDSASEVKMGRITVTIQVVFPFEQRKAA